MAKRAVALAPDSAVLDALAAALDAAGEPVAVSKLKAGLKGPMRRNEVEIASLLEPELASGRLFRFAPYVGKAVRYGRLAPEAYARQLLEAALARTPLSLKDLEKSVGKRLRDYAHADWQALVDRLVREKAVYAAPGLTARAPTRYGLRPPDPRDYLRLSVAQWRKKLDQIAKLLAACGVPATQVVAAALEMLGDGTGFQPAASGAGFQPGVHVSGSQPAAGAPGWKPARPPAGDFAARFDAAFEQIDRQKGSHNFVSLVDLRRALGGVSPADFNRGLRDLRVAGRYELSGAESLGGLGPEEREAGILEAGSLLLYASRTDR